MFISQELIFFNIFILDIIYVKNKNHSLYKPPLRYIFNSKSMIKSLIRLI